MFGQTFEPHDLAIIALLVVLEGVLSIDNALVLGLLARRLPHRLQKRALTYGLVGALVFRTIAVLAAAWLLRWHIVKLLGGAYLIYVVIKHFAFAERPKLTPGDDTPAVAPPAVSAYTFWSTVLAIELTDIAFAVDSILAAIALVGSAPSNHAGPHPKLWVVITGGMLGVVLMRAAAVVFIRLLERWPRFETAAYLLVAVIGGKLLVDWYANRDGMRRVDFHDYGSIAFWVFWVLMLVCFLVGFIPARRRSHARREAFDA